MHSTTHCVIACSCRGKSAFRLSAILLLACCSLLFFCGSRVAAAQGTQQAAPAAQEQQQAAPAKDMPPMPAAPAAGKALVCIYRQGRVTGSASHDHLYVNKVYVGTLLNGEYTWTEEAPGPVVVTGIAKMYYAGGVIVSSAAAVNQTRGQEERIRLEAEAGKIYYMKWTSGMFGSGIKVEMMDPGVGAKEMSKLHPTKVPDEKEEAKKEGKEDNK